jgi:hypothetical protein
VVIIWTPAHKENTDMSTTPPSTAGTTSLLDSDPPSTGTLSFEDAAGFATTSTPDAPPVWAEDSNGTVITLAASADGLSATATPVAPGTANVTVSLSVAGAPVVGTGSVTVTAGATTQVALSWAPGVAAAPAPPAS